MSERGNKVMAGILRVRHLFPLTPLGVAVALAGYWSSFHYGAERVDRVVHAAGLVSLGVVGVSLLSVLCGTLAVWLAIRSAAALEEVHTETGAIVSTGLHLPSLAWWPLLQVRVVWEEPGQVEVTLERGGRLFAHAHPPARGKSAEVIRPGRRGDMHQVLRRFEVGDVFGFCRVGFRRQIAQHLHIRPARIKVTAHVMSRFLGGDYVSHPTGAPEGEMIEMRRYSHGDPLRHILWKAFARTRKLLVRVPEVAINPRPSAAAYLLSGPDDEPAASAARFFVEQGILGQDFLFSADGAAAPTADPEEALELNIASAAHEGGEGLERFLDSLDNQRRRNCVLFVPSSPGEWLPQVLRLAQRMPGAQVISAMDDRPGERGPGRLHNLLFVDEDRRQRTNKDLEQVMAALSATGFDVSIIHRPTGELLSRAQIAVLASGGR